MLRFFILSIVLSTFATVTSATSVAIASCRTDADVGYYYPTQLPGDLTMVWVWDSYWGENKRLVLAHCKNQMQLVIKPENNELEEAEAQVTRLVASIQTYSFADVAASFHPDLYNTKISTIQPDGCLCADEG